jgi:hypothetical protein
MHSDRRLAGLLILVGASALASGCGPRPLAIQGTVTLDGQPVAGPGTVAFYPEPATERGVSGEILNGQYKIPAEQGPYPGKYRVEITWPKKTGKQIPSLDPGMMAFEETFEAIPKKFNSNSELKVEINSSQTLHDFHLKSH